MTSAEPRVCLVCSHPYVPAPRTKGKSPQECCSKSCACSLRNQRRAGTLGIAPVQLAKARQRAKVHWRRQRSALSDITPAYEAELRRKARRCPLCSASLTTKPYLPNSKELDHLVPLCVGGTHTMGNVRIICRSCNLARPKDGSDYTGPVTLWAHDPGLTVQLKPRTTTKLRIGVVPSTWAEAEQRLEQYRSTLKGTGAAARIGNHIRWHEGRGAISSNCEHCADQRVPSETRS